MRSNSTSPAPFRGSHGDDRDQDPEQHFLEIARKLTRAERATNASELLADLDYPGEPVSEKSADEAWRTEVRARAGRVLRGQSKGRPAHEVHAAIERKLLKKR